MRWTNYCPLVSLTLLLSITGSGCSVNGFVEPNATQRVDKQPATVEDDIAVYFSPNGGAMKAIINEINAANHSIDVMSYLISTREIADPLEAAVERGVEVRVIMDAGNAGGIYSEMAVFADSKVPVWRDDHHKEFHHKVMLIDGQVLITGSFNFTRQAEDNNGENLLVIRNHPRLYAAYLEYFQEHLKHAKPPANTPLANK